MIKPNPYAIYLNIVKHIPTDMDWAPTMNGRYCSVRVSISADWSIGLDDLKKKNHWSITISGGDDCAQQVYNISYEEAMEIFDSLKYIQNLKDLKIFEPTDPYSLPYVNYKGQSVDVNGWPTERPCFTGNYLEDQDIVEQEIHLDVLVVKSVGKICE